MHDPLVVAFEIRRPWPQFRAGLSPHRERRWRIGRSPFWVVAGRSLYWPGLITVWHVEPGGADSGEVCKHYHRERQPDGKWKTTILHGWRWHVRHWKIQVRPLQELRRWALTRCAWCGGPSRKGNEVCVSHSWDGPRGRWWQGTPGLFHRDCSMAETAARACVCADPLLDHDGWGHCALCDAARGYAAKPEHLAYKAVLKRCPPGSPPSAELLKEALRAKEAVSSDPEVSA